jgi:hypothetical protein
MAQRTPAELQAWKDAIAGIESRGSGDYSAIGDLTEKGDRAYGRYGVMGVNIGPWSREALGREVSPREFLSDPAIQEAVFEHQFGNLVGKYGNPLDAASAWYTGRPRGTRGSDKATDSLGRLTGEDYVATFAQAIGQGAGTPMPSRVPGQGTQVAQAEPPVLNDAFKEHVRGIAARIAGEAPPEPTRRVRRAAPLAPLPPPPEAPVPEDHFDIAELPQIRRRA